MFVIVLMAVWPTLFTQVPPNDDCLLANSNGGPTSGHPLGFTFQGCDIWSRLVWGARTSLMVGFLATLIGTVIGVVMGALAGFYGGWLDSVLSRLGDIFFAIPYILAAIVVMSVFSQNRTPLVLAFAIGGFAWASTARVIRAEVLRVRQADFVTASRAIGLSRFRTLLTHVMPNAMAPVIVVATLTLAAAISAEATLSFLGVGLGSSTMSWGLDISQAQSSLRVAPMALIYPSIALTVTVLAFIILGELHARRPRPEGEGTAMTTANRTPLLSIRDLTVAFDSGKTSRQVLHGIDLDIHRGETVAIVGESGSGKSTTASAIVNLLPGTGHVTGGSIVLEGTDLTSLTQPQMERIRGRDIGFVPQDPMSNLNPVWSIGFQVKEAIRANGIATGRKEVDAPRHRGAAAGGPGRRRAASAPVPAPVLRRYAPARAHRHRPRCRPEAPDRRRADLGARRHGAARDPRSHGLAHGGEGHLGAPHHPRPGPRRRARRHASS